ncbi:retrovirus-related Pol polyprotein from transposon 17.6 [Trichonephila inaurata madagascariensis]|uniref:Retrovirus-related Pol polyprotein from transposon 17.6 n=1 Tax=Trichonephila inaurata madagascariensis TaxID=2747483 RepID=A0A8X6IJ19_9ARAC|nr:retrovirus-related Pol polyprotein from transposon 17.6 [Trichonephila inaurata madagascariensis]
MESYIRFTTCRKRQMQQKKKYDSYELEVLAIINALKKFRVYLLGQHFKIVTDSNKKTGKKEGFLNPISKVNIPLSKGHVDFIGPLPSTNKSYPHVLTVVDAFTKFTWLYPVKTVSAENALEKLKLQQKTFGNLVRIITDRGSAFTSKLFNDYCTVCEENIQHLQIATGIPRGNGQVERIHRTLIQSLPSYLTRLDSTENGTNTSTDYKKNTKQHYMSEAQNGHHSNF